MKTLILFLLISSSAIAQELNENALLIKEKAPEVYSGIKCQAIETWDDNHEMIVYVINKQADAAIQVLDIIRSEGFQASQNERIMEASMQKWYNEKCLTFDYDMVLYEYKKQLTASKAY